MPSSNIENMCENKLRFLAADTVQKANSGHPDLPMGEAARLMEEFGFTVEHVVEKALAVIEKFRKR